MCYVKQLIISGFIIQFKELIKKEDWFKSSEGSKTYSMWKYLGMWESKHLGMWK